MKKLLVLTALMFISACASGPIYSSNTDADYTHYNCTSRRVRKARPVQKAVVKKAPQPIIVYENPQPAPVMPCTTCNTVVSRPVAPKPCGSCSTCNSCTPSVKVVKEPVEIVYKKTTTTTVYEPKTTTDVSFEKEAIVSQPVSKTVVTTTTTTQPAPAPVQITAPATETISYTIDSTTTETAAPVMAAEEIK